ncbi:MAG: 50S ribosomal protein L17 [Porphyromonadaceae bacterium]|nr:50S ribosomal protein L17 [Porphyromonadaceae bacterium]
MRHNKKFNHLSRTSTHRKAMLANMAISLIRHKRISTTLAKAKALRVYVEPLLTKAKTDTTHSRRIVFSYLQNKEAVTELFRDVAVKIADRPGGYTRILRTGYRFGDNAEMCIIELVDYNENMLKDSVAKKTTRTRRSRRSGAATAASATAVAATEKEAAPKAEKEKAPKAEKVEAKAEEAKAEPKVEESNEEVKAQKAKEAEVKEEVKVESVAEEVKEEKAEKVKVETKAEEVEEKTDAKEAAAATETPSDKETPEAPAEEEKAE